MVACQSANQFTEKERRKGKKEGKSVEEKDAQPTERTAALWGLSSKIDSRIWVNFTRNGLRLGSRHQEPPHTGVSRNLATVVVRGVLPGLRRRRTGLLPSGPKSSFQMRASFVFNLETKVLESGGRVEKLIAQVARDNIFLNEPLSTVKETWASIPPQQCHKPINSTLSRNEAVIKAKGAPTKYWVHIQ